jgi:hypothetical protein
MRSLGEDHPKERSGRFDAALGAPGERQAQVQDVPSLERTGSFQSGLTKWQV